MLSYRLGTRFFRGAQVWRTILLSPACGHRGGGILPRSRGLWVDLVAPLSGCPLCLARRLHHKPADRIKVRFSAWFIPKKALSAFNTARCILTILHENTTIHTNYSGLVCENHGSSDTNFLCGHNATAHTTTAKWSFFCAIGSSHSRRVCARKISLIPVQEYTPICIFFLNIHSYLSHEVSHPECSTPKNFSGYILQ